MNLNEIEIQCRDLSTARASLRKRLEARQKAINAVKNEHDENLRLIQADCAELREELEAGVAGARELFTGKRKTQEFYGITVGFRKAADGIEYPPDADLVDRIEKLLPANLAKPLINVEKTPLKTPIKKLAVEWLQKLGIRRFIGADEPIVQANDDDIEKLAAKELGAAKES